MSNRIEMLFSLLSESYGNITRVSFTRSWWPATSAYEVMIGAILTQNTNWNSVETVLGRLDGLLKPEIILDMDIKTLEELVRPSGFYTQKAQRLKTITRWFSGYGYNYKSTEDIPVKVLRDELLKLHGVGEETADSILVYALRKTSFVVDAYTRRIFLRFGIDVPKKYRDIQVTIEESIPRDIDLYDRYHGLIVIHAKEYCKTKPLCERCPISSHCLKYLV